MKRQEIVLIGSFFMFICIMTVSILFPVMQAARYREIGFEIAALERDIQELEEQNRILVGRIAVLMSPDSLVPKTVEESGDEKALENKIIVLEER